MRLMKVMGLGTVLLVLAVVLLLWWVPLERNQVREYRDLPWQIEVLDPQRTRVLGVTLGETTLASLAGRLPVPDIRLFVEPHGERSVEAYYANARIPPFEANLVLIPALDDAALERMWSERTSDRPMPSGSRRYGLSDAALVSLGAVAVAEMSYIPRARWDHEQIIARFGAPDTRLRIVDEQEYWLYPERGLVITVPLRRGRALMHYVTLERWPSVQERLQRSAPAAAMAAELED